MSKDYIRIDFIPQQHIVCLTESETAEKAIEHVKAFDFINDLEIGDVYVTSVGRGFRSLGRCWWKPWTWFRSPVWVVRAEFRQKPAEEAV